jgi:hypothetical protein
MSAPKEVMDIKDLAEYLSIGKSKIYALITQPADGQRNFFDAPGGSR